MFEELLPKKLRDLYEQDEHSWRNEIIRLLDEGKLNEIDHVNLRVVLAEMGKSETRSIRSHLSELILHILKAKYQPERATRSWYVSIIKQRMELEDAFEDSPSLKKVAENDFSKCYERARRLAISETQLSPSRFPSQPDFDLEYAMTEIPRSLEKFDKKN
jgi:hypothetical protein